MFLTLSITKMETVKVCTENCWHGHRNDHKLTVTALYMDTSEVPTLYLKKEIEKSYEKTIRKNKTLHTNTERMMHVTS